MNKETRLINTIKELHHEVDLVSDNRINDFRNKLANQLRAEYIDFKSIAENTDINYTDNLIIQLDNIFKILERSGINFINQ